MSDNEDERLDRAKRIRKMREGGGLQDDSSGSESPNDEAVDEGEATEETGNETAAGTENNSEVEETPAEEEATEPPEPKAVVPETKNLEVEDADKPSLDAEGDIRAPLPDSDELEDALKSAGGGRGTDAPKDVVDAESTTAETLETEQSEEETRVLEFRLGDEYYCLDIEYIEEIVKDETVTRVPNTPEFVEGVVDLRGQITTILNPKVTVDKDDVTPGDLIVVFDSNSFEDQGHVGWVVDDVRQVSPITDSDVNDSPVEEEYINGVIDRDDDEQFVIWTEPEMAMEKAE